MSSTGTTTCEVELLADARVDELDLPPGARDEPADLLERPLRRREADALERHFDEALEPLQREREVRAALRPRDRVDLVEDHGLDTAQRLARLRGEEQEERLGRRDEDVRRRAQHPRGAPLPACRPCAPPTRSFDPSPASGLRRLRSMS